MLAEETLYGCRSGRGSKVGPFVEIQAEVTIGQSCKIQSHTFIYSGVTIMDDVFVGHGLVFINDRYPRAKRQGQLSGPGDWRLEPTTVMKGASIGSGAVMMCGVTIGEGATVGAGPVVTKDVANEAVVVGVPARAIRRRKS